MTAITKSNFWSNACGKIQLFCPNWRWWQNIKTVKSSGILFFQALINDTKVLALAPLSVHSTYQKQGVGAALIQHAHKLIQALDYPAVVVLGHPDYYAKFGYQHTGKLGLTAPFDVPDGALRVWVLSDTTYDTLKGEIQYADAFFG